MTTAQADPSAHIPAMPDGKPAASADAVHAGYRVDIQLLRALAILLVIIHHARFPYLPGGFLGVDVFFVISGYLMTGFIARALDEKRFSFADFYARRARRLLPAAYTTLALTALVAPFLLDSSQYRDFVAQLAGAVTFLVNFVLWKQSDYFSAGADLKPLLHTWSLSVEEQYYIVLPPFLALCLRRFRLALTAVVTVACLALCFYLVDRAPSAAFYFLPTRAWELGFGSIIALLVRNGLIRDRAMPLVRIAAAAVLAIVPLTFDEAGHPGLAALLVCAATAVLIVPGLALRDAPALRPFIAIGDRSYSLYLVHWPIFAFANNLYVDPVPGWLDFALLVPVFVLTEIQYRWFEQPWRKLAMTWRNIAILIAIPAVMVAASAAVQWKLKPHVDPTMTQGAGLAPACDYKGGYEPRAACASGAAPRLLVWGDSFAMHLTHGLEVAPSPGLIQATRTVCGPLLGIAPVDGKLRSNAWGASCIGFNDDVARALPAMKSVDVVVLSSPLTQYFPGVEPQWHFRVKKGEGIANAPMSGEEALVALTRTVAAIHAAGKRAVLVAPPPSIGVDMGRCATRLIEHLPIVARHADCRFTVVDEKAARAPIFAALDEIERRGIVPVIRFEPAMCPNGACETIADGKPLYRDAGHFSVHGSQWAARKVRLAALIERVAR